MKYLLSLLSLCWFTHTHAQLLSGEIVDENRKLLTETDFTVEGNYEGHLVFEIAVDREGKVTGVRLIPEQSTIRSYPAKIEGGNYLKTLIFAAGTWYPAHHHALVKVRFTKTKAGPGAKSAN